MNVGFAGLGRMGLHMALRVKNAGHNLVVWNRTITKAKEFADMHHVRYVETPKELVLASDIIITMLADDSSSTEVYQGQEGFFAITEGAKIFLEMGTMSPEHILQLHDKGCAINKQVIDAPVSGSIKAASEGTLMIMVGADAHVIKEIQIVLEAMGNKVFGLGKVGAGSTMKLVVNAIIHGLNQTVSEALLLAEKSDVPLQLAYDVIEQSAAAAPMLKYRRELYLDDTGHPVLFSLSLARKDMELIKTLSDKYGVAIPQAALNLKQLLEAETSGFAERDMAAMIHHMRGQCRNQRL